MLLSNILRQRTQSQCSNFSKLQAKELSANFQWYCTYENRGVSNKTVFSIGNLSEEISSQEADIQGKLSIYECNTLSVENLKLTRGILLKNNEKYAVLGDCAISKQKIRSDGNCAYTITIRNSRGQIILLLAHPMSLKEWYDKLKLQCIQLAFQKKFQVIKHQLQNFYQAIRKNSQQQFTVQIFNKKSIIYREQLDILQIYIQILRSMEQRNIPQLHGMFEDDQSYYIIHQLMKGFSISDLIHLKQMNVGVQLQELQVASIIYQALEAIIALNDQGLFHGNINLDNLIINTDANTSGSVYLINLFCLRYNQTSIQYYLSSVEDYLIAPEILKSQEQIKRSPKNSQKSVYPSYETDLYQLGMCLYLLSFSQNANKKCQLDIAELISCKDKLIQQQKQLFIEGKQSQYTYLFSSSQLDLIIQLLESDPKIRIPLAETLRHKWFITMKDKMKTKPQQQQAFLPSLRTILEIVEHSEMDIPMKSFIHLQKEQTNRKTQKQLSLALYKSIMPESLYEIEEDDITLCDQLHNLQQYNHLLMNPSKTHHANRLG